MPPNERAVAPLRSIDAVADAIAAVPYARRLGFSVRADERGGLLGYMAFDAGRYGNARVRALHGGAIAGMLEFTATAELMRCAVVAGMPRRVSSSVEFMRSALGADTFARAHVARMGRRMASMRVIAWQTDAGRPVAAATIQFLLEA